MLRRSVIVLAVSGLLVAVLAGPASAHVTVSPEQAVQGTDAVLTFNVPNEMDNANTTQLEISFPTDHPIADASIEPVPGWTATKTTVHVSKPIPTDEGTVTDAVGTITWTGGAIEPGQFQQFQISVGLPDATGPLVFKALQTYSNGQVVRWIETTPAGGAEPEHPAPVLTLTKATSTEGAATTTATVPKDVATSSDVDSAKTIGIIGIVLGAIGVIIAIFALVRGRRTA